MDIFTAAIPNTTSIKKVKAFPSENNNPFEPLEVEVQRIKVIFVVSDCINQCESYQNTVFV